MEIDHQGKFSPEFYELAARKGWSNSQIQPLYHF